MILASPDLAGVLRQASGLLNQRRFADARPLLERAAAAFPDSVDVRHLLGAACGAMGDRAAAESAWRAALAMDGTRQDSAAELARLLNAMGRYEDAIAATAAAAAVAQPGLLGERARAFQALDRPEERLDARERIAAFHPDKAVAQHNLAAALGDAGRAARAETAARAALALGGDAPETWLVLGRALQAQNRFEEAQAALDAAIARRPDHGDALRDRAQLAWMRSGDLAAARAGLDAALAAYPGAGALHIIRARLLDDADEARAGYALLVAHAPRDDAGVEITAAHLALSFDPERALSHAMKAEALAPGLDSVRRISIEILLANGKAEAALARIAPLMAQRRFDQGVIAAQWTAWALLGDPRAQYDYDATVLAQTIAVPAGWSSLDAFLADLAISLHRLHRLHSHPLDQSLRHGSQTSVSLLRSDDPVVRAFIGAIDAPIRRYLDVIGPGTDALRARNAGGYRLKGMWSVKLRPGGFHVDHVHPAGWLSSAFYVALPEGVDPAGQEGWIRFGVPGYPTRPAIAPGHLIRPAPGMLVLFPSHLWHGTVPFGGTGSRLTVAFDVVPE